MLRLSLFFVAIWASVAAAAIPPDAQAVLDELAAKLEVAGERIDAGDAAGASAELEGAEERRAFFQSKFSGRLGPVKEFRELSNQLSALKSELKALESGSGGSTSTTLPPKSSAPTSSSSGPPAAPKPSADGLSSSGPAAPAKPSASGVSSSGPAAPSRPSAPSGSSSGPALAPKPSAGGASTSGPAAPARPSAGSGSSGGPAAPPKRRGNILPAADIIAAARPHIDGAREIMDAGGDLNRARAALDQAAVAFEDVGYVTTRDPDRDELNALRETHDELEKRYAQGGKSDEQLAQEAGAAKTAAADREAAEDAMEDAWSKASEVFAYARDGRSFVYGSEISDVQKALELSRKMDAAVPALREAMEAFAAGRENPEELMDYKSAQKALAEIEPARKTTVDDLLERFNDRLADVESIVSMNRRMEVMDELTQAAGIAVQIDPSHAEMRALLDGMEGRKAEMLSAIQGEIDAGTLPKRAGTFSGPGDPDALEKAAIEALENDKAWGKNQKRPQKILAAVIQGPWQAAEHDIFGQVISWRLPMAIAITDPKLEPQGVAQVFEVSMVTFRGAGNQVAKAPPFDGAWVGDNHYMRIDKLP